MSEKTRPPNGDLQQMSRLQVENKCRLVELPRIAANHEGSWPSTFAPELAREGSVVEAYFGQLRLH